VLREQPLRRIQQAIASRVGGIAEHRGPLSSLITPAAPGTLN
jgi:hypothetical protein